jgi:hypothetical protein
MIFSRDALCAMRETSGSFGVPRPIGCQRTAHRAMRIAQKRIAQYRIAQCASRKPQR